MAAVEPYQHRYRDPNLIRDREKDKRSLKNWWKKVTAKNEKEAAAAAAAAAASSAKDPRPTTGIFSVALVDSMGYASVPISYIDDTTGQQCYGYIPTIVAKCGSYLKEQGIYTEGVFRLSGSAKRIWDLQNTFDSPPTYGSQLDWKGYSVHDAATVLRRYLNYLPDHVVTHALYKDFRAAYSALYPDLSSKIHTYQLLIERLPLAHQFLLLYLLDMLAVFAANSQNNRMDVSNLSAVFTPGILSHSDDLMNPVGYKLSTRVIEFLVAHQAEFNMPAAAKLNDRHGTSVSVSEHPHSHQQHAPHPLQTSSLPANLYGPGPGPRRAPTNQLAPPYLPAPPIQHPRQNAYIQSNQPLPLSLQPLPPLPGQRTQTHPVLQPRHSYTGPKTPPSEQMSPDDKTRVEAAYLKQPVLSTSKENSDNKGKGVASKEVKPLGRSQTVPSKRAKWGKNEEIQVVRTGRKDSQGSDKPISHKSAGAEKNEEKETKQESREHSWSLSLISPNVVQPENTSSSLPEPSSTGAQQRDPKRAEKTMASTNPALKSPLQPSGHSSTQKTSQQQTKPEPIDQTEESSASLPQKSNTLKQTAQHAKSSSRISLPSPNQLSHPTTNTASSSSADPFSDTSQAKPQAGLRAYFSSWRRSKPPVRSRSVGSLTESEKARASANLIAAEPSNNADANPSLQPPHKIGIQKSLSDPSGQSSRANLHPTRPEQSHMNAFITNKKNTSSMSLDKKRFGFGNLFGKRPPGDPSEDGDKPLEQKFRSI